MLPSSLLDTLYEQIYSLAERKSWYFILAACLVLIVIINGLGVIPEEPYQRLSQNPFTTRTDIHFNNYWQESPLLPLIAYYLGFTGTITFNAMTFFIIIGAYAMFAWFIFRRWGSMSSLVISTLLITSPLTTILLSWLGTPDGLTVALTIPFLFSQSSTLMLLLAVPGTANHPTFIIAALEILILRWFVRDRINIKHLLLTVIGMGVGYAFVKSFTYSHEIEVVSRFNFMQLRNMSEWIRMNMNILPISIFSLFNIHWIALFSCLIMFYKKDKLFYSLVLVALLTNYVITFFTLDTTRVFSLLSWGVFFVCILHSYKLASSMQDDEPNYYKQFMQMLIITEATSFITPRYISWAGEIYTTPFYKLIGWLIK